MEGLKNQIWEELVKIMCKNPKCFPIVKQIMDSDKKVKVKKEDKQFTLWFAVSKHIGLNMIFNDYYESLSKFWYLSDVEFKDKFKGLVIKATITHYFPIISVKQSETRNIKKLLDSIH